MLFNSFVFVLVFLPVVFAGFFWLARVGHEAALLWLVAASLAFYGWWSVAYLPLLLASVAVNYGFGTALAATRERWRPAARRNLFLLAVAVDLAALAFYKYLGFFRVNLGWALGYDWPAGERFIPLGISFFTFTQIAYLADVYAAKAREYDPRHYALFVTFFPHLIAGPILHHREMMPQFARAQTFHLRYANVAVGLTIFFIGLFKKTVCADGIARYANAVFDAAAGGTHPGAALAWSGAAAYSLQLYFDFSGYSDMAIGLARLFGVRFPVNFHSPYKAADIIDFWRRWHMTLSRFLRDYLYIPLGGNRRGARRRYVNLMATMLLGGLWHGAAWTFVIWGGLHGLLLVANHGWRAVARRLGWRWTETRAWAVAARGLTFLAVLIAWVPFRASDMAAAGRLWGAMAGFAAADATLPATIPHLGRFLPWILPLLAVAWFMPNTQQILRRYRPVLRNAFSADRGMRALEWRPTGAWLVATLAVALVSLAMMAEHTRSDFLYFQF